ncbi:MAG TPA: ABC transporter substrate-binding protein [Hyphomicrobiaceae bacterium]|nr:ABC transporter substrate-binding protein [Hyphomicrobiaceae bacterium]
MLWSAPAALLAAVAAVAAEVPEVRFARQFSMSYLQFNLMERQHLVEKHAKAAGIAQVKVVWATFNSPAAMNDALLSGSVDIVSGGVPGLLTIWSRTQGTANSVKGIAAFTSQPILLNSRNPNIRGIADFTDKDKIALPAVKVSIQAIILQMAAAKAWGRANFATLDPITVGMSPPDATVALLSGSGEIASVFSVPPFQNQATEMLGKDVKVASQYWVEDVKAKMTVEKVAEVATGAQVKWTMVPESTMQLAEFMHSVGSIKAMPSSWKDLFFAEIHALPGG